MEILGCDGGKRPILPLDVEWDTGLALYCAKRWPVGRRKAVIAEWDLTDDEARSVVEGKASKRIISKIWKHPRGGWEVALPVMGAVIGHPVSEFFRERAIKAAKENADALEHERVARAAYRRLALDTDGAGDAGHGSASVGETGRRAGTVGAQEARRVAR